MSDTTERADSVSTVDFLTTYVPMAKAGKTNPEICKALKMKPNSYNTKLSVTRMEIKCGSSTYKGGGLPDGKVVTGEQIVKASVKSEKDASKRTTYRTLNGSDNPFELVTPGIELVKAAGSRDTAKSISSLTSLIASLMGTDDDAEQETADADVQASTDTEDEAADPADSEE